MWGWRKQQAETQRKATTEATVLMQHFPEADIKRLHTVRDDVGLCACSPEKKPNIKSDIHFETKPTADTENPIK